MKYYNLKTNKYIEIEENNRGLNFLYSNVLGRIILKIVISKPIRNIYNKYMTSKYSLKKIDKFIKNNNINMDEYQEENYKSFNDFFIRKIKDDKRKVSECLFAIADSKLSVYKIDDNSSFKVKNSIYTIDELLQSDGSSFKDGYALIFRLCVDDYHHYVYPDDGEVLSTYCPTTCF